MDSFRQQQNQSFSDYLKDPRKLLDLMNKNRKVLATWASFALGAYAIYAFFSSGDFSFILTLGSLSRSATGISKNSLICYSICLISRLISIMLYNGYLPYDDSGDFIYRISELIQCCTAVYVLYLIHTRFRTSYNRDMDNFQWFWFVLPTLFLGILFHPNLNQSFIGDIPWTFAIYLEAFSMLPQINLFRKKGGEIESFTSAYVASSGISKFLIFLFWVFTYEELNDVDGTSLAPSIVGYLKKEAINEKNDEIKQNDSMLTKMQETQQSILKDFDDFEKQQKITKKIKKEKKQQRQEKDKKQQLQKQKDNLANPQQPVKEKKDPVTIRQIAGMVWEDKTMADWGKDDYRIFVGNLGNEVTDTVLSNAFRNYKSFIRARVVRDKRSLKTKGYGFVSFGNSDDYLASFKEMNGKYVGNRPCKIEAGRWKERMHEYKKQDSEIQSQFKKANKKKARLPGGYY
ncbi:hypothetical protein PPERSA_05177 [Pseudocohnilembus persalinus]|uniref:RRM domain-containing protein n=1 Tax=Pseudocohnilembus persalinus TaxID=266149 RepID=A0A0V0R992_PSEPJ|nr:hypothetical protein PPERSA_05177 [Pseudocohnilembus persalinus]|eukprot:KRX11068.1 hypothetical protein PPERSA_05177 [Pseudocohnilembus persalinus]